MAEPQHVSQSLASLSRRLVGRPVHSLWDRYEQEKGEWVAHNPTASPAQYTKAMRAIARRLGL